MEETTKNNDVNFGNDWFGLGDNSLTPTPTPEQLSSMSQETPVQGANEGVKQSGDFGSYSTATNYSFLDTSNGDAFQIGADMSDDGYDKSMYEFAQNQLEDYSDFYWGLDDAQNQLEDWKRKLKDRQERADKIKNKSSSIPKLELDWGTVETVDDNNEYNNAMKQVKEAEKKVTAAQEKYDDYISRRDNMQKYIDTFKDKYSQEPKEEPKKLKEEEDYEAAEQARQDAYEAQFSAYRNLTMALLKAGMDYNLSASDVLEMANNSTVTDEDVKYSTTAAQKAGETIARKLMEKGSKGGSWTMSVGSKSGEKTEYTIKVESSKLGGYELEIFRTNDQAVIATGTMRTPNIDLGFAGTWNIKDADGNSISKSDAFPIGTGNSESDFAKAIGQAIATTSVSDYQNNVAASTSSVPKGVLEAAQNVSKAEKAYEEAVDAEYVAINNRRYARDSAARAAEKAATEKYKSGEYSALDYANALAKATRFGESVLRPVDEAEKARSTIAEADESTELGTEARGIYNNISEWAKAYREKIDAIDVSNVDESNYKSIENNLYDTLKNLQEDAKIQIEDLAKAFFEKGASLDDFRNSKEIKTFSQELFNLAQDIYDKAETINHSAATNIQRDYASTSSKVSAVFDKLGNKLTNGKDALTDATLAIEYLDSLDAVLDSSKALMKSAAYNGAQNTKGGQYAEAWKKDTAIDKLSTKEWVASAATGTMGLLGIIGGSVIMAANPIVGGALFVLGLAGTTGNVAKMSYGAKSFTNEEQMFSGKLGLYNSLVEPANIGDRRAASTYTKLLSGASKIGKGISQLDPSTVTSGVLDIKQVVSGGLSGRANDLYENMYKFANIWDEINGTDFESLYHSDPKAARDEIVTIASSYGTSDDKNNADAKYSGYREEAVNSNLAKDYNEGMEKETNEAVSDKYVKVFKVMLENEPDYIRKVLIAIPKNHSEAEW